jgi:predicted secreted protein
MATTTAIAIYFLIWWIVLFAVLPWGVQAQGEDGDSPPGTDPGAPRLPKLLLKLIWTTGVTTVVWALCALGYTKGYITLDGLAGLMGLPQLER